jgi:DNA-directed RNA polymerase subunit N
MIPVRCFSCGKVIGDRGEPYELRAQAGESLGEVLNDLGFIRHFCRRVFVSYVELVDELMKYDIAKIIRVKVLQAHEREFLEPLRLDITGITPICGDCALRSYTCNEICASFGCVDSREYGGISENELALGIPFKKTARLLGSLVEMYGDEKGYPDFAV